MLETWWDSERTRSSRRDRQRGLWLRAVLTVDPGMASLDYQRLVVGYPGGPYSDEALVRLAMIASSDTDLLGAAGYYRILLQDYPRSPERVRARQWLSDHSEEIEEAEEAAALEAQAAAEARRLLRPGLLLIRQQRWSGRLLQRRIRRLRSNPRWRTRCPGSRSRSRPSRIRGFRIRSRSRPSRRRRSRRTLRRKRLGDTRSSSGRSPPKRPPTDSQDPGPGGLRDPRGAGRGEPAGASAGRAVRRAFGGVRADGRDR